MDIAVFENPDAVSIERVLRAEGHRVTIVPPEGPGPICDLVIADVATCPDSVLDQLATRAPSTEVVMLVGDPAESRLESGMVLVKPVDLGKVVRLVRVVDESRRGQGDPREVVDFEIMFSGDSPAIIELLRRVRLLGESDAPVWLHGELGSGRAIVARAIHDRSARRGRMFMAVNAASLPGDLLEEHLFGGAEPLARRTDGGTLFIDAVTELSPGVQAKLLRLLEERALRLRGVDVPIDVRVMVGDERRTLNVGGRLRRELYFHLKVHELELPSLRERARDLHLIIGRMLDRLRNTGTAPLLSSAATRSLEGYPFPGNIRELAYALTHAVVLSRGGRVELEHLPFEIQAHAPTEDLDPDAFESLDVVAKRFERDYLLRVIRAVGGNRTRAAKILSLSRKGLWQKLKAFGIAADEGRTDEE